MKSLAKRDPYPLEDDVEYDEYRSIDDDHAEWDLPPCRVFAPNFMRRQTIATPPRSDRGGCSTPITAQLNGLLKLDDAWYDEPVRGYDANELQWLASVLDSMVAVYGLPTPYIYPTPEGLVRAEWSSSKAEVIVNIDASSRSAEVIASHAGSDDVEEIPVVLGGADAETTLGQLLVQYVSD
jgi:hypothetical protein